MTLRHCIPLRFFLGLNAALLCLALLSPARGAEPREVIELWKSNPPGEKEAIGKEIQQPMRQGDDTIRVANVTQATLEVFRPAKEKANGTAVVICPGGGYKILAYNKEGTEVAEWLNTLGVTGIVLKYRVPSRQHLARHGAALMDAQRAMGIVRERATELGIDPQRVGILGFSAGGHLAATLSNQYDQRTYAAVDAADKQSCRPDFAILIYPAYLAPKADNALSPELRVTKETPPSFIAMTQDDHVRVQGGLFYYLALTEAKVPAEMHLYPTGGHGYGLRPSQHFVSTWPARAADWLRGVGMVK